ncbi:MAG TPA: amino acid permease [Candidatus Dormibacteraeota bacterium]|nr:amino acid permease [Candidatus Dormibacteraeota bacterium]
MSVQAHSSDVETLHRLGYAQELRRRMSGFSNFAISFTIISILSGCLTLYGYGMNTGGPVIMNIGWPVVGLFVLMVGLAMAEVCSNFPTAGGLYYWAAKLGGKNGPAWSWFTGWFNLLGQVGITAGIDFGLALFADALLNALFNYPTAPIWIVVLYTIVLAAHGALNTFGVGLVALLNDISVWWHLIGVAIIFIVLFFVPAKHQTISYIFTGFVNNTGFGSSIYVFLIGLLLAQYTFTGYDASAHLTEETHNAARSGPRGIVWSIIVSLIAGWVLLIAVTGAIQNYSAEATATTPGAQIFLDAAGHNLGLFLLFIIVGAQFYCGMSSVTSNSRMLYAFSRDGAMPGSEFWHRINPRTRTPTNSIIFATVGAWILGLPYLWSPVAYAAVTSIAVIGLYIAYGIPILLRLLAGEKFQRGPWHLGRYSYVVGWIAVVWIAFIAILFILPQLAPGTTLTTFNYSIVAVAVVVLYSGGYWFLSAKNWFKGPKVQGTAEELAKIEAELEAVGASAEPFGAGTQ